MANLSIHKLQQDAFKIFMAGVQAVSPCKLVSDALTVSNNKLVIRDKEYSLHRNVHLVAFGKAVLGMVRAVEGILGSHIVQGVASVPYGSHDITTEEIYGAKRRQLDFQNLNKVEIIEAAKDNYPDEKAQSAARKIMNIAQSVKKEDILVVLVSGGGSALLPLPVSDITLEEKLQTTKVLSKKGASIFELNTVRKHLSQIKGGKLAEAAYPASVITLILSDVLGDPLDIIACGPTVPDMSTKGDCVRVIEKLGAYHDIPSSILKYLNVARDVSKETSEYPHVQNVVVGNNKIAVIAAASMAEKLGYHVCIHSTNVCGEARDVGRFYANLGASFEEANMGELNDIAFELRSVKNKPCCILGAGETTVSVKGNGQGGRNQELALAAALEMSRKFTERNILLLSAGTDGQDGPTPAAGAYAFPQLVTMAASQGLDALEFINNNDSFAFYSEFDKGQYLLKTGLTGTNVMDLQVLLLGSALHDYITDNF